MNPTKKSFTVSPPREGNYETFPSLSETGNETSGKPTSLKALAARVLARNQQGNFNETCTKQGGNFSLKNNLQKFHSFTDENQGTTTLPEWCNSRCEHRHRLELPDLGAVEWCCFEQDATHWRRVRIGAMIGCPMIRED